MVDEPRLTVWFAKEAPSTQPTQPATGPATAPATRPAGTTVAFGQYADVEREKVFVKVAPEPAALAKVSLSQQQWERLSGATPLALRDRRVLDVDPERVEKVTIAIDRAATTQPTSRPAEKRELVLERRRETPQQGPAAPAATAPAATAPAATAPAATAPAATAPATVPTTTAATAPATAPAEPSTKWVIVSEPKGDADDAKVDSLLQGLHPLRVTKYLEAYPTTPPAASYVLSIHTNAYGDQPAKVHEIKLVETGIGADAKVVGQSDDLTFEVDRFVLDRVTGDFAKKKEDAPSAAPSSILPPIPGLN
jgi:hypothetical protein